LISCAAVRRWISPLRGIVVVCLLASPVFAQMQTPLQRPVHTDVWQSEFRVKALTNGIPANLFDAAFARVAYSASTRTQYLSQAEFLRPIWAYLDDAVSASRVATGRQKADDLQSDLQRIGRRYGVEPDVLLAIWGMETSFGSFRGRTYTIEALANIARDGHRRDFGETELLAALRILASGVVTPKHMLGGWSGAMGDTQFMPTTYMQYAVDGDGDGARDFWSGDPLDALASSANYLHALGWKHGQPWGMEVVLPKGFDYAVTGEYATKSGRFWRAKGVRLANGGALPDYGATALLLPAGAKGPVFAVFSNFQVIRRYNMSVSYAIAVGHLADRIGGAGDFIAAWPRSDAALSSQQARDIQQALMDAALDVGGVDGRIGPKTVAAIQSWQQAHGLLADGYATTALWQMLQK